MPVLIVVLVFLIIVIALILILGQPDIHYNFDEDSNTQIDNLNGAPTSGVGYSQQSQSTVANAAQGAHQSLSTMFGQQGVNIFLWILLAVLLFLGYKQLNKGR
jgi:hypothetical protein